MSAARTISALLLCAMLLACDGTTAVELVQLDPAPETAPAGSTITLGFRVDDGGKTVSGVAVHAEVERGGGQVSPPDAVTAASADLGFAWTLGPAPVANRLRVEAGDSVITAEVRATLDEPLTPEAFGDVNAFLATQGIEGSTEDLAFSPDGTRLVLGVPGGLVALDAAGNASMLPTSGDELGWPLGIAYDQQGNLWAADAGKLTLIKIAPDGAVTTVLTEASSGPFEGPNYVGLGPDGLVYVSDPCIGELLQVDPETATINDTLVFDLETEGGPNGFAFDAEGVLYLVTENTVLLCGNSKPAFDEEIGGLFRVTVSGEGFGELQTVAANVGLFGDGVAFDAEDNLYAIFDRQENLALSESTVFVLPAGADELVPFLSVSDHVLANLAFGTGAFGETTLYIALLAVAAFTPPEARGVERFEVGITGLPLQ